jgi:hypothetical protein
LLFGLDGKGPLPNFSVGLIKGGDGREYVVVLLPSITGGEKGMHCRPSGTVARIASSSTTLLLHPVPLQIQSAMLIRMVVLAPDQKWRR